MADPRAVSYRRFSRTKRILDLGICLAVMPIVAPILIACAIAVRIDSPGPILFRQQRTGRHGVRFGMYKFRTMVANAEELKASLAHLNILPAPDFKIIDDPRITRVGRFMRKTSLDELPQFWNIARGEMSVVGPRPLIESEDCQIAGWARSRLELTPGLTGLWQVLGRTSIPFEEMVKLDYLYVTNWSLWADLRLILRTVPAMVTQRGAN